MKKNYKKYSAYILATLCVCSMFFFVATSPKLAFSQSTTTDLMKSYVPLTSQGTLDQFGLTEGAISSVPKLLEATFKFALGAAAALSVLMITLGGIEYLSTDSLYGKSEGKEKIENAIYGLLLAIAAYLIMYIINPDTLEFKFLDSSTSQAITSDLHA